jgi:hypothetical protein
MFRRDTNLTFGDIDHDTYDSSESTEDEFVAYNYSHSRGHGIMARIQTMLGCRADSQYMYHVRESIKHSRMAELHRRCADLLRVPDPPESDLKLVSLFEKYIPISGYLSSDEYTKLINGIEPVPIPFEPLEGNKICRQCRNLNLRKETFQNGSSRFVSSIMGDLSAEGDYLDKELEKTVEYSATRSDVKHQNLGGLEDIANRPECSFCRLITDCFMRLSKKEFTDHEVEAVITELHYDGIVWLSVVPDPAGDHPDRSFRGKSRSKNQLENADTPASTGRTRIVLSILPEGEVPEDSSFQPPFYFLNAEIFPYTEDDEGSTFHALKWSAENIDTRRPQKWLHACETYHGDACSAPPNYEKMEIHEDMLLVDIEDECLVRGYQSRRYFALSYVWGTSQKTSFQTKKATVEETMKPGGLSKFIEEISNTIIDGLKFASQMNVRYLWVDALCIVQDDEESKPLQINHMDAIYRQAVLTIVAGDNSDSSDGISGLDSRPREKFQRTYNYRHDLTLTANGK